MLKGPYFIRQGLLRVSGKAILTGSQGRGWLPNHLRAPFMAFFIFGRLSISACLSSSMWAGLIVPESGSERERHQFFPAQCANEMSAFPFASDVPPLLCNQCKRGTPCRDKCLREVL